MPNETGDAAEFALNALSPLDGRYAAETEPLQRYFSELALIRERVRVEVEYLLALGLDTDLVRPITGTEEGLLRGLVANFTPQEAQAVKAIEQRTRHDVKALEYYLRGKLAGTSLVDLANWLHFGLTSEDVNLIAEALVLRDSRQAILLPALDELVARLRAMAQDYKNMPLLGRTHGQPAVPTTLGKELAVYISRLRTQRTLIAAHHFEAKLTGAVGNWNALVAVAPHVDWPAFSERFVRAFGLEPNLVTTQLLPYDNWVRFFDGVRLLNTILVDLVQDLWRYVSDGYLKLRAAPGEVGSSTMPQKVNPIDFENAEGNLGLANALLSHYALKLPVSRLQRDLSDSTVRRTFGVALGHSLVAYMSLTKGLDRVEANEEQLRFDLEAHWEVVAEGAQIILRAAGQPQAFETLGQLTRGRQISREDYKAWVGGLEVDAEVKARLQRLTPFTYIGLAEQLTERVLAEE